jgi:hypothetical protein
VADPDHIARLMKGVTAWNGWRDENCLIIPDLCEENLSEGDLSEGDLSGADLSGANLGGADLRKANLSGALVAQANLTEANLSGANLSGANLSGANRRSSTPFAMSCGNATTYRSCSTLLFPPGGTLRRPSHC